MFANPLLGLVPQERVRAMREADALLPALRAVSVTSASGEATDAPKPA